MQQRKNNNNRSRFNIAERQMDTIESNQKVKNLVLINAFRQLELFTLAICLGDSMMQA